MPIETDLEFPADPWQLVPYQILLLFLTAGVFSIPVLLGWSMVDSLLSERRAFPSAAALLAWVAFLALALGLTFLAMRVRPFSVENRIMRLSAPVRLATGVRTRRVPLDLISDVVVIGPPDADPGIIVTLKDGTKFSVFDGDLPQEGAAFLRRLANAFDRGSESVVAAPRKPS